MTSTEEKNAPTLSEFVSATILDIANGLHDAQTKGRKLGVKIYPDSYEDSSSPMDIEFDLIVSSTSQGESSQGVRISVASIFSGGKTQAGVNSIGETNRIRFTLPVRYVVDKIGEVKHKTDEWNPVAGKM